MAGFSALQRAEIAEMRRCFSERNWRARFSALQRAEIAEIVDFATQRRALLVFVSVLFNEPKLLKCRVRRWWFWRCSGFSALQRAEIAEIQRLD